jgi:membrane protein DedA with SNARE-associated domain
LFDWIADLIEKTGYLGIFVLTFLENVFPPIPSELIMPLAGFKAAQGALSLPLVIAAGTAGSLAGAGVWYWAGRKLGQVGVERLARHHGRWLTMCPPDVKRARDWFERHGAAAILVGRLVPAIRSVISLPAGIARMPLPSFLALSAVGTAIWTSFLVGAGYLLESQYDVVADYLNPVSNVVFAGLVLWYLWRVATFGKGAVKAE